MATSTIAPFAAPTPRPADPTPSPTHRWLALGAAAGPVLFTLGSPLLHLVGGLLLLVSLVMRFPVTGLMLRTSPRWRRFGSVLLLSTPLARLRVGLYFGSFDRATTAANQGVAGLTQRLLESQRLLALEIQGWFVAMGWLAFTRRRSV